jgi:hypothetical protein
MTVDVAVCALNFEDYASRRLLAAQVGSTALQI